tara:strand:- start:73 stop:783 length:711 start_codon:yes stop_codon:yes gene_type:complete
MAPIRNSVNEGENLHTWSESLSEGPGPWAPRTEVDGTEYGFPLVDFWTSSETMVSMGKVGEDGNIEHNFVFTNATTTTGTIIGPIDSYTGRFSIVRHDTLGNLEMNVNVGTNSQHTNAFDVTLTIIPLQVPYLHPQLHIGGREGVSQYAANFSPPISLASGTMMEETTGFPFYTPTGSMIIDQLLDLERTVGADGVPKYGARWWVKEEYEPNWWNDDTEEREVQYGIAWTAMKEDE